MRKRELVHMHALLDRVGRFMRGRDDLEDAELETYSRLDVAPAAVFRSKGAHEAAVTTLSEALAEAVGETVDREDEDGGRRDGARSDDRPSAVAEGGERTESTAAERNQVDARSD
ncbi:UPF0058 family protein [Halomarina litorea]|uniref:UPF0058 family protein n=1 Tax=Halomarina litorea TaxID=2961595 RepID=UPI0020C3F9D6|nr:UPF0058 family protein [Halomarina sp. BCD28]